VKFKFLSLNLWHGRFIERCAEFLAEQDADIVILQEVHNGTGPELPSHLRSLEVLQQKLNYPFYDHAAAVLFNDPQGKVSSGNAVLSKFKITRRDHQFMQEGFNDDYRDSPQFWPVYPRVLQYVELETEAGPVNVFNLHGVWDLDGDSYSERRRGMADKVIKAIAGKPNVLLGGDTNAKASNRAIKQIEEHVKSVFGESLQTTFNMRRKDNPGYASAAVDLLFVSPNIKILQKACVDADVSDHLPVMAELEIN